MRTNEKGNLAPKACDTRTYKKGTTGYMHTLMKFVKKKRIEVESVI